MMRTAMQTLFMSCLVVVFASCGAPERGGSGGGASGGAAAEGGGAAGGGAAEGGGEQPAGDQGGEVEIVGEGEAGEGEGGEGEGGEGEAGAGGEGGGQAAGGASGAAGDEFCGEAPDVEGDGDTPTPCDSDGITCEAASGQGCQPDRGNPGTYHCELIGPNAENMPCGSMLGGCGSGLICVTPAGAERSQCMRMCVTDEHCPGARACNGSTVNGEGGVALTKTCGAGAAGCNPYCSEAHCPAGTACFGDAGNGFGCLFSSADASPPGGSCAGADEGTYNPSGCQPGSVCNPEGATCVKVCRHDRAQEDCPEGTTCSGFVMGFDGIGFCLQ